ncbi:MAG: protein translocase subunit SecD [Spirochaetales bacterium]|nr:protein translocase subunit SecD [Spirochaetales bacterium]
MSKRFRLFTILILLGVGVWFLYPTVVWYFFTTKPQQQLASSSLEQIRDFSVAHAQADLKDLQTLYASNPKAVLPSKLSFLIPVATRNYNDIKLPAPQVWTVGDVFKAFTSQDDFLIAVEDHYRNEAFHLKNMKSHIIQLGLDLSGGMSIILKADLKALAVKKGHPLTEQDKSDAIGRAIDILKSRIDQFGVSEPLIKREAGGGDRIYVELPGEVDPDRVNSFLRGKGSLTLSIVDDAATNAVNQYIAAHPELVDPVTQKVNVKAIPADILPAGLALRTYYKKDRFGLDQFVNRQVVKTDDKNVLDGTHIQQAIVSRDPVTNQPTVNFVLDSVGASHFFQMTQANVGKTMAVVLDHKIRAGARISEAIPGGSVQVTGFDQTAAQDLAVTLRTGALPVSLIVESYTSVGSTLGQDAINAGINASMWGLILVGFFMLAYYKGSGINADLALIINMFLVMAVLSVFNMTLTLTSIAGLVLTVGISVDANVIIFERIKEEYWSGKSPATAIDIGFKRAFWTIMDSHVTALIASLFLSLLSKGAVQGFAVTMAVGLISSLFTSLFVSRLIFDFEIDVLKARRLSITWRKM